MHASWCCFRNFFFFFLKLMSHCYYNYYCKISKLYASDKIPGGYSHSVIIPTSLFCSDIKMITIRNQGKKAGEQGRG